MKARSLAALALLAAAACSDDATPTAPEGAAGFLPCLFGSGVTLEVGEVVQYEGTAGEIPCLDGAGEYTLVPFFASSSGEARLRVSVVGGNVQPVSEPRTTASRAARAAEAHALHMRLRERMHREMDALRRHGPAPLAGRSPAAAVLRGVPSVGDLLQVNVPLFGRPQSPCEITNARTARVAAVTRRAIVLHDQENPAGGFTDAEYRAFAERFDDTVFPVDSATFGLPTDIDASGGRVVIFFTREVNALTPPESSEYVGGFFWAGDLIPPQGGMGYAGCRNSNASEIFYMLVPDPSRGDPSTNPFTKENVQQDAIGTLAHELEHLINASRRIYVHDADLEDPWLDEGLAHIAEELMFYRVSGLGPRENITVQTLAQNLEATETYVIDNLVRYLTYLEEPDSNSLIGNDALPTRGAAWAFLRYAADREPGPDQAFFFDLVNSDLTGVRNVSARIGAEAIDWMQDWTLSVYTDDVVPGVAPEYQQPSWNFRSIMRIFSESGQDFPLKVIAVGSERPAQVNLRAGGAAFFRFGIASGGRVGIRLATPGRTIPDALRVSIVRTQ